MVSLDLFNAFIFFLFIVSCILPNFISLYGLFVFPHVLLHFVHQIYVVAPYALLLNWKNASMHWKKSINIRTNIYWGTKFWDVLRFLSFFLSLFHFNQIPLFHFEFVKFEHKSCYRSENDNYICSRKYSMTSYDTPKQC